MPVATSSITLITVNDVAKAYASGKEIGRMQRPRNLVEWERTCELLTRWLPPAPAVIADIGGGPGDQAAWMVENRYQVKHFDLTPLHVEVAAARGLDSLLADARAVPLPDASVDAITMLGPLYHLAEPQDRALALAEAYRILKPGGVLAAAALSRWARVLVKAAEGLLGDPVWHQHTMAMMRAGRAEGDGDWDAISYRHDPTELATEIAVAGYAEIAVVGVEGPAGAWARRDPALNEIAIDLARQAEIAMAACSIHLMGFGRKPL